VIEERGVWTPRFVFVRCCGTTGKPA